MCFSDAHLSVCLDPACIRRLLLMSGLEPGAGALRGTLQGLILCGVWSPAFKAGQLVVSSRLARFARMKAGQPLASVSGCWARLFDVLR